MRALVLTLVAGALLGGLAHAQLHSHGWFVTGQGHLHYVSPIGGVTSIAWPGADAEYAMMHWDNRTVLVHDFTKNALLHVDPKTLAVVGTFAVTGFGHLQNFQAMAMCSAGDIFFGAVNPNRGVFKLDHNTFAVTTIYDANTGPLLKWPNQFATDVDTGEIIVGDDTSSNDDVLYLVHRDGSKVASIGKMGGGWGFTMGSFKHIPTGDIYSGEYWGNLNVLKAGSSVATLFKAYGNVFGKPMAPHPDRASASKQVLVTGVPYKSGSWDGLWIIDLVTKNATKFATIPRNCHRCIPVFGNNVHSVSTGKGKWDVHVSFPSHPKKVFMMALGASGVRAGLPLPDGRLLPLVLDRVAIVSITTGLFPLVKGNIGTLDGSGEAIVKIDLNLIGKLGNGLRIYMCAVVLDGTAPLGIAVIADPKCLVVEGL